MAPAVFCGCEVWFPALREEYINKNKLRGFSPQANYTDRATGKNIYIEDISRKYVKENI
jgi:hypothetical protein